MKKKVLLNWQVHSAFGWGILGLNIVLHWANDSDVVPFVALPIVNEGVSMVDPLRLSCASAAIAASNDFVKSLERRHGGHTTFDGVVIDALTDRFEPSDIYGDTNVGRCVFEDTRMQELEPRLTKYDVLLCGSNWNADLLRSRTRHRVEVIFEGIDPSLFHPGPKSGLMDPDRFYIFSGGKVEYRKAQDLVLLAFKEFSKKHRDAYLVTAWHSPWPKLSAGYKGNLRAPLQLDANGNLDIKRWAADNDVDPARVIEIFSVPNQLMPPILREMDVALQPSRAEACTNLPVKEAMACGVPVIVADNTGMKDLITEDNCVALRHQAPIADEPEYGHEGWRESSVDEIVEALETLRGDPRRRKAIGARASDWVLNNRTWQQHASNLKDLVLSLNTSSS